MTTANALLSEDEISRIQDIVIEQLDAKREQLTPDARLTEDLGADSLDKVEITMALEEEFDITAPDKDVEEVESMQDLYDAVATLPR